MQNPHSSDLGLCLWDIRSLVVKLRVPRPLKIGPDGV
jgi:hypothetical protein